MRLNREDFLEVASLMTAVHSPREEHVQEWGTPASAPSFGDDDRLVKKPPEEAGETGQ